MFSTSVRYGIVGIVSGPVPAPRQPEVDTQLTTRYPQLAPAEQPTSVHEIAERLFPAYSIQDGLVRLAGCSLDDRLFVRVTFGFSDSSKEAFFDADGTVVESGMVHSLGLTRTKQLARPPIDASSTVARVLESATRWARREWSLAEPPRHVEVAVIWCKYARGKLRFSIGGRGVDLPFSNWARLLTPPPFVCPHTGIRSFRVAATDDGRIVAAEAIARCEETGTKTLQGDLITCAVTGKRVLPIATVPCPVSGEKIIKHAATACSRCKMEVHPGELEGGGCSACRDLAPIRKNDARLARILGEYPDLERWGRWKLHESGTHYWLRGSGWMSFLMLVLDRESLEIVSMAKSSRFRTGWKTVPRERYVDAMKR